MDKETLCCFCFKNIHVVGLACVKIPHKYANTNSCILIVFAASTTHTMILYLKFLPLKFSAPVQLSNHVKEYCFICLESLICLSMCLAKSLSLTSKLLDKVGCFLLSRSFRDTYLSRRFLTGAIAS